MLALLTAVVAAGPTTLLTPPFSHTMGFNRIGRFYLNMYLGPGFRLDDPQGMCGAKMVEEDDTTTYKDDHVLTMFAVNSGSGQVVYNVRLSQPRIYGKEGSGAGQFREPRGICCNPQGDVYVADKGNNRLVRLRYSRAELSWVGVVDSTLSAPSDVSIDSRGRVHVTDTGNDRVCVYGPDGARLATWPAGFSAPTGIAVIDRDAIHNLYGAEYAVVIDDAGRRLSQLTLSGALVRRLDSRRIGLDTAGFAYCAFDLHGNAYVTDAVNSEVHLFDSKLNYVISHGRSEAGTALFDSPRGITIWRRFGQVFISEADGGQYYWVGLDGYFIGCFPEKFGGDIPGPTIALYVTEVADVRVEITDSTGRLVRTLTPPHEQRPGEVLIVWDGRDNHGHPVAVGAYDIKATIRPTYSRPKYILKKELTGRVWRVAG